jgi:hypothetical protein
MGSEEAHFDVRNTTAFPQLTTTILHHHTCKYLHFALLGYFSPAKCMRTRTSGSLGGAGGTTHAGPSHILGLRRSTLHASVYIPHAEPWGTPACVACLSMQILYSSQQATTRTLSMVLCWAFAAIGVEEQGGWEAGGRAGGMGGRWKSRGMGATAEERARSRSPTRAKRKTSEIQINIFKYKRKLTYGLFFLFPFPKIELVLFYT